MPNDLYRARMITEAGHAVAKARDAARLKHPGLTGEVRELVVQDLLQPILPQAFAVGSGKIVDAQNHMSAQTDVVLYNRQYLPALMDSGSDNRRGVFPVESVVLVMEVKSQSTSSTMRDAIKKAKQLHTLSGPSRHGRKLPYAVYFAFDSDLKSGGKSEMDRYKELDPDWATDPSLQALCVVGSGHWGFVSSKWTKHRPTDEYDEILVLLSQTVNTILPVGIDGQKLVFGNYLKPNRG